MRQVVVASLRHEGDPVKGSRFIVDVAPAGDEPEARQVLTQVRANFPDASHHCWAWRIANPAIDRANDDGEPSGSAGRPILAQLVGRDLVDTAVIVTRYFGGTKLGVGGLVRAYGGAAGAALDSMSFETWTAMYDFGFDHEYAHTDAIERLVGASAGIVLDRVFAAAVGVRIRLPVDGLSDFAIAVANLTAGSVLLDFEDDDLPQ